MSFMMDQAIAFNSHVVCLERSCCINMMTSLNICRNSTMKKVEMKEEVEGVLEQYMTTKQVSLTIACCCIIILFTI